MKTKTFDCVELKLKGAERVMKRLEGMTPDEELKYWQEGTAKLRERQKELASKKKSV